MKVWVKVDRSKAILAGKNIEGWQLVEVDMGKLALEEREYMAKCSSNWQGNSNNKVYAQEVGGSVAAATEEAVIRAIREQIEIAREEKRKAAEKAKKEAEEREKEILGLLSADAGKWLRAKTRYLEGQARQECYKATGEYGFAEYYVCREHSDPRLDGKYAEAEKIAKAKNEVVIRDTETKIEAYKTAEQARQAEAERVAAAKKAQIEKWVAEKGTENQRKRYEIGLLPEAEVTDAIRDEAYRALDEFARYEKMSVADVCTCEEHYNDEGDLTECDVDYEVSKASGATAEEYEAMEKIANAAQKAHPGAVITMMDHVGTGEDCESEVVRKSAKAEIEVGAFRFSREYAI